MNYIPLSYTDLALAACLLLVNGGLSLVFRLGIGRSLLIAGARTFVQLSLVGLVLSFVFAQSTWWMTAGVAAVMALAAGREVSARQDRTLKGLWSYGLGTGALVFAGVICTVFAVGVLIQPDPWYGPATFLPILGMVFGNTLTGVALAFDSLSGALVRERPAVEARLALGHSRRQALQGPMRRAMRAGLMPIINAMSASGIVALPGMMTGQILAGTDPQEAVKYQVMIMFLLAGAVAMAVLIAVLGMSWRLTDERHRLRLERLLESRE